MVEIIHLTYFPLFFGNN